MAFPHPPPPAPVRIAIAAIGYRRYTVPVQATLFCVSMILCICIVALGHRMILPGYKYMYHYRVAVLVRRVPTTAVVGTSTIRIVRVEPCVHKGCLQKCDPPPGKRAPFCPGSRVPVPSYQPGKLGPNNPGKQWWRMQACGGLGECDGKRSNGELRRAPTVVARA